MSTLTKIKIRMNKSNVTPFDGFVKCLTDGGHVKCWIKSGIVLFIHEKKIQIIQISNGLHMD